jgi:hypothetical protein
MTHNVLLISAILPRKKLKIKKLKKVDFKVLIIKVRIFFGKICKFGFHCLAKNIQRWLNICIFILVCSYIWLNLLEDDHNFLHVRMEYDYHFGYKQKILCNKH